MRKQRSAKKNSILGITGSLGSGKTTVAKIFRSYGAQVINADDIAHKITRPGTKVYNRIIAIFGKHILKKNRIIDRCALSHIVFENKNLLKKLNKITHPEIIKTIKEGIKKLKKKVIVLDAPLLIEAGLGGLVDKLIVVETAQKVQIERAVKRSHLKKEEILKRIRSQIPLKKKVRLADFVIDNSGTLEETRKQVRIIWRSLVPPQFMADSGLICKPVIAGKLRRLLWKN